MNDMRSFTSFFRNPSTNRSNTYIRTIRISIIKDSNLALVWSTPKHAFPALSSEITVIFKKDFRLRCNLGQLLFIEAVPSELWN